MRDSERADDPTRSRTMVAEVDSSRVLLRGFLWSLVGALTVALLTLARQDWSGAGDLSHFLAPTAVLAGLLAVLGLATFHWLANRPAWFGYLVGGIAGVAAGFLLTIANLLFLGAWSGAGPVPLFFAWCVAGGLGVAAATGTRAPASWRTLAVEGVALPLVAVLATIGTPVVANVVTHNQQLTVVFARWYDGDAPLEVEDQLGLLRSEDVALLTGAGLGGRVVVRRGHSGNVAQAPKARMVVLMSSPVTNGVRLLQPDATTLLYVQRPDGFERFPRGQPTLDRVVELRPAESREGMATFSVEGALGRGSGGDLFRWSTEPP